MCRKPPHRSVKFDQCLGLLLAVGLSLEATLSWPKHFFSTGIRFLTLRFFFVALSEESEEAPSFLEYSTEMQCILSESTKHALNATIRVPLE